MTGICLKKIFAKKGRWIKRNRWGKWRKNRVTVESGDGSMGFVILFSSLHAFENFHLKNLKEDLGLYQIPYLHFLCEAQFMIKLSQEPCTTQYFPSLKTLPKPLTQGHLEPSGPTCFSFYWKEQKNSGFVEAFLHFFRQMHLSPGMGHLCPEATQTLTQRDPCGAGTARWQCGG